MPSEIESAIYGDWAERVSSECHVGQHCVVEFTVRHEFLDNHEDVVVLGVVPEEHEHSPSTIATFRHAHVGRILQPNYDPEYNGLPWSIVGFHCKKLEDGQWSFQLNCDTFRIQWSSDWPLISKSA